MRQHIEHLLAASAAVGLALFISYFSTGPVEPAPIVTAPGVLVPVASSTLPAFGISTSTLETLFPALAQTLPATTTVAATATPPKKPVVVPAKVTVTPQKTPTTTPVTPTAPVATTTPATPSTPSETSVLTQLRSSIVNIICIARDGSLRSTSGSGVIIDSRGIILTVAHVAQSSLLQEYFGSEAILCTIRTGSPARNAYYARPVYISEPWLKKNATTLISSQPKGTGEYDFALLAITGSATGSSLPSSFTATPLASAAARVGDKVSIGSYGAQSLSTSQVRTALIPTLVESVVDDRFTFGNNTVDLLAIGGSAASQEGSSGGAVVNEDGELIGLITTSEITGPVADREMRAITPTHIRKSFEADMGKSFTTYLSVSITGMLNGYAPKAQELGAYLAKAIGLD